MAEGHPHAWEYTIGRIFEESAIVEARKEAQVAELSLMMRLAISSIPNMAVDPQGTEESRKRLNEVTSRMLGS